MLPVVFVAVECPEFFRICTFSEASFQVSVISTYLLVKSCMLFISFSFHFYIFWEGGPSA